MMKFSKLLILTLLMIGFNAETEARDTHNVQLHNHGYHRIYSARHRHHSRRHHRRHLRPTIPSEHPTPTPRPKEQDDFLSPKTPIPYLTPNWSILYESQRMPQDAFVTWGARAVPTIHIKRISDQRRAQETPSKPVPPADHKNQIIGMVLFLGTSIIGSVLYLCIGLWKDLRPRGFGLRS